MIFRYWLFCAGCSLMQQAAISFSGTKSGAAHVSTLELMHPRLYPHIGLALNLIALGSITAELWLGVHLFSWWPGLVLFIPLGFVPGFVAALLRLKTLSALGLGLAIAGAGFVLVNVA